MKTALKLLIFTISAGLTLSAHSDDPRANYRIIEDSIELATVQFYLRSDLTGTAVVRDILCNECAPKRLKVTKNMKIISNSSEIPWDLNLDLGRKTVTVFFNLEQREITRIQF